MTKKDGEGWLINQLEIICKRMLEYHLHRERIGINRFSKETTKLAKLAHNLEKRGVEVIIIAFFFFIKKYCHN